jgi:hypothetical protein
MLKYFNMAGLRGNWGDSTSGNGLNLPHWAWLLIIGGIFFVIQFILPDPVSGAINDLLQDSYSSSFTGFIPFLKAFLIIWKIAGIGLPVAGIVDLVFSRHRRSQPK